MGNSFAAIDIGSNAMRMVIAQVGDDDQLSCVSKSRASISLGRDVFKTGKISKKMFHATIEALKGFKEEIDQKNVRSVRVVATSAMRNAENRREIAEAILKNVGLEIEIIDGLKEAEIIFSAIKSKLDIQNEPVVAMDIGGGSVEILYADEGRIKRKESLPIGTIRSLELFKYSDEKTMRKFIESFRPHIRHALTLLPKKPERIVGTGGNIDCLGRLRKEVFQKKSSNRLRLTELQELTTQLESCDFEQRKNKFDMNDDRADVIMPASHIVRIFMEETKKELLEIPRVGLKEGLILNQVHQM